MFSIIKSVSLEGGESFWQTKFACSLECPRSLSGSFFILMGVRRFLFLFVSIGAVSGIAFAFAAGFATQECSMVEYSINQALSRDSRAVVEGIDRTEHGDGTLDSNKSVLSQGVSIENVETSEETGIFSILEAGEARYEAEIPEGKTVYEFMEILRNAQGLRFNGKPFSGLGFFVEEINGVRNNPQARKYWVYYVNGKKANIGISQYIVQSHDIIEWKYEDEI